MLLEDFGSWMAQGWTKFSSPAAPAFGVPVNTTRPVVVAPDVTLQQLLLELADPQAQQIVTGQTSDGKSDLTHADDVAAQLKVKVCNLVRQALGLAPKLPPAQDAWTSCIC
jgi:hypothetical protein